MLEDTVSGNSNGSCTYTFMWSLIQPFHTKDMLGFAKQLCFNKPLTRRVSITHFREHFDSSTDDSDLYSGVARFESRQ
jgi:hypothetical protein